MRLRNTMRKKSVPIKFEIELVSLEDDSNTLKGTGNKEDSEDAPRVLRPKKLSEDDEIECVSVKLDKNNQIKVTSNNSSSIIHSKVETKSKKRGRVAKTKDVCLPVGSKVSAKYKGAFCQAKISKVDKEIKYRVSFDGGIGVRTISEQFIDKLGSQDLCKGANIKALHPDRFESFPKKKLPGPEDLICGVIDEVKDQSTYTVVFDDKDTITLKRSSLRLADKEKPKKRSNKAVTSVSEDGNDKKSKSKKDSDTSNTNDTKDSNSNASKKRRRGRSAKQTTDKPVVDLVALNIALSFQKDKSVEQIFSSHNGLDISSFLDVCMD